MLLLKNDFIFQKDVSMVYIYIMYIILILLKVCTQLKIVKAYIGTVKNKHGESYKNYRFDTLFISRLWLQVHFIRSITI